MQFSTWSFPRLAAVLGLAGMMVGAGISFLQPTQYVARTELALSGADNVAAVEALATVIQSVLSRTSLSLVIQDPRANLYREELRTQPLEDVIGQMRPDIVMLPAADKPALEIQFTYHDKAKAEYATRALGDRAVHALEKWASSNKPYLRGLETLDVPSLPTHPLPPNPWITTTCGLAAGLLLALVWNFLRPSRSAIKRTIGLALAGSAIGASMFWLVPLAGPLLPDGTFPLRYESRATLFTSNPDIPLVSLAADTLSRPSLVGVITDGKLRLYGDGIQNDSVALEAAAARMRRDLDIAIVPQRGGGQRLDIRFTYSDRFKAMQTVETLMQNLDDRNQAEVARRRDANRANVNAVPAAAVHWGRLVNQNAEVQVASVSQDRQIPILAGLCAGLVLASIVAAVRRRWMPLDEAPAEDPMAPEPAWKLQFNRKRFLKLGMCFAIAGAACGVIAALRAPVRYTYDALVTIENMPPDAAEALISSSINGALGQIIAEHGLYGAKPGQSTTVPELKRVAQDLTWNRDNSGAGATAFRMQYTSDTPETARGVLNDVLGAIDKRVFSLHGHDQSPFESVRGVDGALINMGITPGTTTASASIVPMDMPDPMARLAFGSPPLTVSIAPPPGRVSGSLSTPPQPSVPSDASTILAKPAPSVDVAFDDDRAKPVPQPEYRNLRMRIIDPPGPSSKSAGVGWWVVGAGGGAGLLLAVLISLRVHRVRRTVFDTPAF